MAQKLIEEMNGDMGNKKKIVDAREDDAGRISHVRFADNKNFTPVEKAIPIAERGEIDRVIAVQRRDGSKHLRTKPDGRKGNNLDEMAKD